MLDFCKMVVFIGCSALDSCQLVMFDNDSACQTFGHSGSESVGNGGHTLTGIENLAFDSKLKP